MHTSDAFNKIQFNMTIRFTQFLLTGVGIDAGVKGRI
jgi:hypothetical protein